MVSLSEVLQVVIRHRLQRPQKPGDLTMAEWFDECEVYYRQLGLENLEKATALVDNLRGAAKEEALCADDIVRQDPDKLKELIWKIGK